jgi:hypothetical protein
MLAQATLAASAFAIAGCSAAAAVGEQVETGDQSDEELRISPKDSEALGRLVVNGPAGWLFPPTPANDATVRYSAGAGSPTVQFGTPVRIRDTSGCIEVTSKFGTNVTKTCNVAVTKNNTTTVNLGSITARYDGSNAVTSPLYRDFGPRPALTIRHTPGGGVATETERTLSTFTNVPSTDPFWGGNPSRAALVAPGEYRFSWGIPILDDVRKTIADGEQATLQLAPEDRRATIVIKPPVRELPDAPPETCQTTDRSFLVWRNVAPTAAVANGEPHPRDQRDWQAATSKNFDDAPRSGGSDREAILQWRPLPVRSDTTLRVFPFTAAQTSQRYDIVVNGMVQVLDVRPGATSEVTLERLDVDDVEVEREDGSTYKARGTYVVWRENPAAPNNWIPVQRRTGQFGDCSGSAPSVTQRVFPTNTGVDVLPGSYRVQVRYNTAEQSNKELDFFVKVGVQ